MRPSLSRCAFTEKIACVSRQTHARYSPRAENEGVKTVSQPVFTGVRSDVSSLNRYSQTLILDFAFSGWSRYARYLPSGDQPMSLPQPLAGCCEAMSFRSGPPVGGSR